MFRQWLLTLLLFWSVCPLTGQDLGNFRHAALDSLVPHLQGIGKDSNLFRIDGVLRAVAPNADPELLYFLRRYRSEQLYYRGLFDESMVEAEKARRIAEVLKDSLLLASSLNQVAVLLEELNDDEQGIILLKEASRRFPKHAEHNYPLTTPHRIQGNLGLCWAKLGELDSARICQERSLALAQQAHDPRGSALALLELGYLESARLRTDSALVLFGRSISTATDNDIQDVLIEALCAKADAYADVGRVEEVLGSLKIAHAVMAAHDDIAPRSILSFLKSEMRSLAKVGRYEDALVAARSWRTLDRSIRSSEARSAQRILQEMHATDAALVDEHDRASITAAELKAEERTRWILALGSTVVVILLVAMVLIFIIRSREKARIARLAVLQAEQERQIAELRIRQQVAEDLHDDLGAGLSALKLTSELAADLSTDSSERALARTLANISGNLIASMRHILWSLSENDQLMGDLITYISDRARAFCAEYDRTIVIRNSSEWPAIIADAEVRHLAWPVVREALDALITSDASTSLVLELRCDKGISIIVGSEEDVSSTLRTHLAERIAAHHPQITRIGGWLRVSTEGAVRMEVFLPCKGMSQGPTTFRHNGVPILTGTFLALCVMTTLTVKGQGSVTYRNAGLDRLFSETAVNEPPSTRISSINTAITAAEPLHDDQLTYHLLMARAKLMYYQGLYDMGIADVNRSLELAQAMNDSLLIATTYNMIGLLNENLDNDAITLSWFREAARWLPRNVDRAYPVVKDHHIHGNIAQCLLNLGRYDSAEYHFKRSFEHASSVGDQRALALANLGLARTSLAKGKTQLVEEQLDSAQAQALRCVSPDVYVDAIPVRAQYFLRTAGPEAAKQVLDAGVLFLRSDTTINRSRLRKFFEQSSLLREAVGQYEGAYDSWCQWQHVDSVISATDDQAALTTLRIMLDNGQRLEGERAKRERDQAQLAIDRALRATILYTTGTTSLLLLAVFALLFNRQRNKRNMVALDLERLHGRRELAKLRTRQRLSEDTLAELGTGLEALRIRSQLSSALEHMPEDRARMTHISAQASELITSLRQIVWALDTDRSSLSETVRFTAHYASTYAAQQGFKLRLIIPTELAELQLSMEQRRNIFLVVKEALHNVVKHARATEVELGVMCTNELDLRIADNGRGPSEKIASIEGNGLRNMRKRIEAIGGMFETSVDCGMVIHFTVPLLDNNGSKK